MGIPGPAIGFLQETLRWWDLWLKGIETGMTDEPMLRVWMQDSVPPTTHYTYRSGRWVGEPSWPSPHINERRLLLAPGRLTDTHETVGQTELTIQSPLTVGLFAGKWCSYAAGPDLAHDQRQEDGGALVFESAPLSERLEILGAPMLELEVAADKPVAMVAVRLSDVAPDDKATRVTYGLLNLTHRESSESPSPLVPGRRYRVVVKLNEIAQSFPEGHRLRVSISTSYWPLVWPSPTSVRLTVVTGVSVLTLPVRGPRAQDSELPAFLEPEGAPPLRETVLQPAHYNWWVTRDLATDVSTLEVLNDEGVVWLDEIGLELKRKGVEKYSSLGDDIGSVRGETLWERGLRRSDWSVRTITRTVLTSDITHFRIRADLDAYEGDVRVFARSWDETIPRNLV